MAYGVEVVIPTEIQGESLRITHFEPEENEELLRTNLTFLEEKRNEARARYELYQSRIQHAFNRKVRKTEFQVGDLVLRQADALQNINKLEAIWELPYTITKVLT